MNVFVQESYGKHFVADKKTIYIQEWSVSSSEGVVFSVRVFQQLDIGNDLH